MNEKIFVVTYLLGLVPMYILLFSIEVDAQMVDFPEVQLFVRLLALVLWPAFLTFIFVLIITKSYDK
jgi:hypothetical protein